MQHIYQNIYSLPIPLPKNPLKELNCYVILGQGEERNLLIDSGFRRPECWEALSAGMAELGIDPEKTDVFFTHLHSDHMGNAAELQALGCRLMLSRIDLDYLRAERRGLYAARMLTEGMPEAELQAVIANNPAFLYAPGPFEARGILPGEELNYGGHRLECLHMPGHTPGHMCLYDRENQIIFLGDHVLFDITPNICFWIGTENSLGDYLNSLDAVAALPIKLALPAHRSVGDVTVAQRAEKLKLHHSQRLAEAEAIVKAEPGVSAYTVASRMTWQIRCKDWNDFPVGQKWFALGEATSHMDKLCIDGRLRRVSTEGFSRYYPAD